MTDLHIAVTELADFCHRSGDIDHRFTPSPTGVEGIAGHQRLYARRPPSYCSEYAVEYAHKAGDLALTLRGRADGYDPQQGLVEEIKTCRVPPNSIPEPVALLHLAQGRLYAAIIARRDNLDGLAVRVTWLNIDSDEEYSQTEHYSQQQLCNFLDASLAQFTDWLQVLAQLRTQRNESLATLAFPHGDFRTGQREIAELTYKCIDQGGQLLLEAPTGIGKTAAVLYPALKALATDKHDKVVFTTAKTVGRRAAEDTLAHFRAAGYRGGALSLTAKDKICLSPGRACHGDDCPYARGYYDKLPAALHVAITQDSLRREELEELAQRFEVCPYELTLDLLPWMDVIIGDLHYVYSFTAALGSAMETGTRRWTVLLDEAHNLPGRARGMYSARLGKAQLMQARAISSGAQRKALDRVNSRFLALQKQPWQAADFDASDTLPQTLLDTLQDFTAITAELMAQEPAYLQRQPPLMDFYFDVLQFLRAAEQFDSDYRFQLARNADAQSLVITLNCLDPTRLLNLRQQRAHAVTAFSATLSPPDWARTSLGLDEQAVCSRSDSPFSATQLKVTLATDIDTRYRQREASIGQLSEILLQWLQRERGNCIVYFPSYAYLQACLELLQSNSALGTHRTVWQQQPGANDVRQQELLQLLQQRQDVAAFCILGGVFGEGIDLPGEQLSSVVVVGVGMPQVNRDTKALQAWHEQHHGAGFEFAYLYPGMQKVDQALGRVVRGMDDHGSALLIDPRYSQRQYRELLPAWWTYQPWHPTRQP